MGWSLNFRILYHKKAVKNVIEPPSTRQSLYYNFPVVRMFLHAFSHKQCAETSVHGATHLAVTKMTIVNFFVNILQHNFNKQF